MCQGWYVWYGLVRARADVYVCVELSVQMSESSTQFDIAAQTRHVPDRVFWYAPILSCGRSKII